MHRYYYFDSVISSEDCDSFVNSFDDKEFDSGQIKLDDTGNEGEGEIRKSKVLWIDPKHIMVRAVWSYILEVNTMIDGFNLLLDGYEPKAQLTKYDNIGDNYSWHTDTFISNNKSDSIRKLSLSLQLSKPEDYKGSELQLFNGDKEPEKLPINQGSIVIFRSEEWHRVTQLLEGVRYSLVFWGTGPRLI